jgi:hypothetical protein
MEQQETRLLPIDHSDTHLISGGGTLDTQYDAFEHLSRSLFKTGTDLFGMITAYFDDSGTSPNNSVAAVAGYIGSVAQWERFNVEWNKLLSQYELTEIHRTDLESRHEYFPGWTTKDRDEVVNKLQKIIKARTYVGVGNAVIKADFVEVFPPVLQRFFGGPYGYCALLCIARARYWYDEKNIQDSIDWVFEAGAEGAGQFHTLMSALYADPEKRREFKVKGWSFRDKTTVPLQAADVLAYELFKFVTNRVIEKGQRDIRISFDHLVRSQDYEHLEYWSKERLQEYVASEPTQNVIRSLIDHGF